MDELTRRVKMEKEEIISISQNEKVAYMKLSDRNVSILINQSILQ